MSELQDKIDRRPARKKIQARRLDFFISPDKSADQFV